MGSNDTTHAVNIDEADLNDAKAMTSEQRQKLAKIMANTDYPSVTHVAM